MLQPYGIYCINIASPGAAWQVSFERSPFAVFFRVQAGLNKGKARTALASAVFFNRLGEIENRRIEQQRYRASDLNLETVAN